MMNPSQRGMALIYKVGGTDLWARFSHVKEHEIW